MISGKDPLTEQQAAGAIWADVLDSAALRLKIFHRALRDAARCKHCWRVDGKHNSRCPDRDAAST